MRRDSSLLNPIQYAGRGKIKVGVAAPQVVVMKGEKKGRSKRRRRRRDVL